ncbi:MAG: hypothetical protein F6K19_25770 [Cyanothece sp. SIO1E1]|nr:hypothetical protein [Cyanothece sp. SIO1E1]
MAIASNQIVDRTDVLLGVKGFLLWTFLLEACLLVVGFPLTLVIVAGGAFVAVALQAVMPVNAVLVVSAILVIANLSLVISSAAILTAKKIHPRDVSWLGWLHQDSDPLDVAVYASCPLTCEIKL